MRLIPWNDEGVSALQNRMNRLLDDFFTTSPIERTWMPAVDVEETDNDVLVRAEVPGIDAKDIEISVTSDSLVIKGEKRHEEKAKGKDWHRIERRYGAFSRVIPLPCAVDVEKVEAQEDKGVLTVRMAKHAAVRPKRVTVQAK